MYRNEQQSSEQCDEYIREYAFEPELLINRDDYLRQEQAAGIVNEDTASRLDDTNKSSFQRRVSNDIYNEFKNQVDVEIEAFYYVSVCACVLICGNSYTKLNCVVYISQCNILA